MYKSNIASKLLEKDFFILTRPLLYVESNTSNGFSLYIPPGFLVEKPLLNSIFHLLLPSKYTDCLIMYIYLLETRSVFYKKKPMAIEKKGCDTIFLDMLETKGFCKKLLPLVKVGLKTFGSKKHSDPAYLLRKNAVEFYIREKAKLNGYP